MGFRSDIRDGWDFPKPTHSLDSLVRSQWVTGEYWKKHRIPRKKIPAMPAKLRNRVERIRAWGDCPSDAQWVTVRDAISDLPDPYAKDMLFRAESLGLAASARSYRKHTGSSFDEPGKTVKAGSHGVPGGENMLAAGDGTVRYFTVRECARLQTFPDDYSFAGSWCRCMQQLGNAVPVEPQSHCGSIRCWLQPGADLCSAEPHCNGLGIQGLINVAVEGRPDNRARSSPGTSSEPDLARGGFECRNPRRSSTFSRSRILPMLGEINLAQWKCLAELIDNSVDGFLEMIRSGMTPRPPRSASQSRPAIRHRPRSSYATTARVCRGRNWRKPSAPDIPATTR